MVDKFPILEKNFIGSHGDGKINLFTLKNKNGLRAQISNFGGIIASLWVPDRHGKFSDVVLGFDSLEKYFTNEPYFGCIIGRFGNRIANGIFTLDNIEYRLNRNNGDNHLHGGIKGFHRAVWDVILFNENTLTLHYRSEHMEEGYPGNLDVTVTYSLTEEQELKIEYNAATDKKTIINLTHHAYFNLRGEGNGNVLDHRMMMNADTYTPVNSSMVPTGQILPVEDTPMDFRSATPIGSRINAPFQQLITGNGYDHNWVLNSCGTGDIAARVEEPVSGRIMEVYTSEPGVQFYTGNFLDARLIGKSGKPYPPRSGFCLETQHFPDSPNHGHFPSVVLHPGEKFQSVSIYRFPDVNSSFRSE